LATTWPTAAGNQSRFQVAADAIVQAARSLPEHDLLSIGSFARELRWWSIGKTVKQTVALPLPPADVLPAGPTNLEAALKQVAASLPDSLSAELLLLTDAEANFADPPGIAAMLRQHRIRLDVLAIGDASANGALAQIIHQTGGQQVQRIDPAAWAAETKQMLRAASPDRMIRETIAVTFQNDLAALPPRTVSSANRTWLKDSATLLATEKENTKSLPMAAHWQVGAGQVIAIAFTPTTQEIEAMAHHIAKPPRDPRFSVQWQSEAKLHVTVNAQDHGEPLNGAALQIQIGPGDVVAIPQTGPGRYEIDLPSPRSPQIVSVRNGAELVDQFAVAGRYPAEFNAVGNDDNALMELTKRTGGEIIEPTQHNPITFRDPRRTMPLASVMAALGAGFIAFSVLWWQRKG
jgi:hypothetical protein